MSKQTTSAEMRQAILALFEKSAEWSHSELRAAALASLPPVGAYATYKRKELFRRTLSALLQSGELLADGDKLRAESAPTSLPASGEPTRKPKAKHMKQFLEQTLADGARVTRDELISRAVSRFGVSGEQVNGVTGLVVQVLLEGQKEGTLEKHGQCYALAAPKGEAPAPTPAPQRRDASAREGQEPPPPAPAKEAKPPVAQRRRIVTKTPVVREVHVRDREQERGARLTELRFAEHLHRLGGAHFNEYCAGLLEAHFRARGYAVTGRYIVDGSDDKGVDVVLQMIDTLGLADTVLIQAKTRNTRQQITLKEMREFYGVIKSEGASRGIFIATTTFTTDAIAFVRGNADLAAIDLFKLFELAVSHEAGVMREGDRLRDTLP